MKKNWYSIISTSYDLLEISDFVEYYQKELDNAKDECKLQGYVEKNSSELPSIIQNRFTQLQEIEAVLDLLNRKLNKLKFIEYQNLQKNHSRTLSSTELKFFSENSENVLEIAEIINLVALIRNKYLGLMKGLETKAYQLGNITKLRVAGMEDSEINF